MTKKKLDAMLASAVAALVQHVIDMRDRRLNPRQLLVTAKATISIHKTARRMGGHRRALKAIEACRDEVLDRVNRRLAGAHIESRLFDQIADAAWELSAHMRP